METKVYSSLDAYKVKTRYLTCGFEYIEDAWQDYLQSLDIYKKKYNNRLSYQEDAPIFTLNYDRVNDAVRNMLRYIVSSPHHSSSSNVKSRILCHFDDLNKYFLSIGLSSGMPSTTFSNNFFTIESLNVTEVEFWLDGYFIGFKVDVEYKVPAYGEDVRSYYVNLKTTNFEITADKCIKSLPYNVEYAVNRVLKKYGLI